jgi:hypothetical protein
MVLLQTALFISEVLLSLGHVMNLKWVIDGKAFTGAFCTAQGTFLSNRQGGVDFILHSGLVRHLGTAGIALATLVSSGSAF